MDEIAFVKNPAKNVVVACLNPHSFVTALQDGEFHEALLACDHLLPDGEGIILTMRTWGNHDLEKIAGDDLHTNLLSKLNTIGGKVYYMGSTPKVLSLIEKRLAKEYPSVSVRTWAPSICDELSENESQEIMDDINSFSPDILFVSMTAPKQEKWVAKYSSKLTKPTFIASIGGVFEFYAGTQKRAPHWAIKIKVEWLVRLIKEPRRMWRRNFISTPKYLYWTWKHRGG